MRTLTPIESRAAAWLLTAGVLVLAWWVLVQSWWVDPLIQTQHQIQSLRHEQQRNIAFVAQRDALQQRLASLSHGLIDTQVFLAGNDPNAATASLMQRAVAVVQARQGVGPCKVTQKMPVPPIQTGHAPYHAVSASIILQCGMAPLVAVLYDLTHGNPYVWVSRFQIDHTPWPAADGSLPPLNVDMTLSGYLRAPVTKATP